MRDFARVDRLETNKVPRAFYTLIQSTQLHIEMAFSILYWINFVSGTEKLHQKYEVAFASSHVLKFVHDFDL